MYEDNQDIFQTSIQDIKIILFLCILYHEKVKSKKLVFGLRNAFDLKMIVI